jgi:maltose-binding protein MalE
MTKRGGRAKARLRASSDALLPGHDERQEGSKQTGIRSNYSLAGPGEGNRRKTIMTNSFTRRTVLQGTTAAAAAGAFASPAFLDWAKAWAQTAPWKPEPNAALSMLRWKYFVEAEDAAYLQMLDAFTKATGVKVTVSRESYEDVQPKASVAANTGAGPDLFWGLYSLPHLFPQKCVDVTDVADYLDKKYGPGPTPPSSTARAATSGSLYPSATPAA